MEHDVFIIHAHKDKSIADAIRGKLESAGLKCWIPTPDISAIEDRAEATRNAIGSSRVIVLVLSENANEAAATHIGRKIAHAFYARRIIIPFRLGETLPRREFLFYLGNIPWVNAVSPPAEEHLEVLTARIKGLMPVVAGNALSPLRKTKSTLSFSNSWVGDLRASHYRTLGVLKWVGITTLLCAVGWVLWFNLRHTKEGTSLAESRFQSMYRGVSPTRSPQAGGIASDSTPTAIFTRFGLWQAKGGAAPMVQQGPQDPSIIASAERSANVKSSPQPDVSPGEQAGELASEPRPRHLPPLRNRVSHDHHQQYPGTQVKEARKIVDLENQRDLLRSQLKDTEAKLQTTQTNADLLASQRDALQKQIEEAKAKARAAQDDGDLARSQRDALQAQLKETEAKAQVAQKNADLATRERDALETQLGEAKERAQLAETNANLAASQRDAIEVELKKTEEAQGEKAQLNQRNANLAELSNSAPDTQFRELRKDAQPAHENAEFAQTQPPNPGQDAKPAPLTQALDPLIQPGHP